MQDNSKKIFDFMDANQGVNLAAATVMVGLSLLDDNTRAVADADNIRAQIKGYVEEATDLRIEADRLRKEMEVLKGENQSLKNDLGLRSLRDRMD